MTYLRNTTCLMAMLIGGAASPVWAQESNTIYLGEIVISPSYWDEIAREAAVSASIVEGDTLIGRPSQDLDPVVAQSANLVFQSANSNDRLIVRGLSAFDNSLADPVGHQVNGVSLPLGTVQLPHFFAAEQVTLLKGPQGTTAGRNASAGLLTFDTIAPGALGGWRANIGVTGSDAGARGNGGNASLLFSDAISDAVALTFGVEISRDEGVISDPIGDDDGGEKRRLNGVFGVGFELDNGGYLEFNTVLEREENGKELFRYVAGPLATDRYETSYNHPSSEDRKSSVTSLEYQQEFGNLELTSITGFTTFDRDFSLDFDTSQAPVGVTTFDLKDRMLSQEIRLASQSADGLFKWSAGLHAFSQSTDVTFNLGAFSTSRDTKIDQTGLALFGFGEYALTERFRLGAGLRLDWIESEAEQSFSNPMASSQYEGDNSSLVALPKLTASYDLSDQGLLFGSLARGYLPAGYNYAFASDADSLTYDAEYSWSAEIGYKHSFANGAGLSLAAFYTRVEDKQITETIPGAAQRISNAAEVETYGVEAEFNAPLNAQWSLGGQAGLLRTNATSFETMVFNPVAGALVAVDYSGNDLPLAPNFTYGLSLAYDGGNGWSGELGLNGSGSYFFDAGNSLKQDGTTNVSLQIRREVGPGTVTFWADNLLDEEYFAIAANTPNGVVVEDGKPRRFGLDYTVKW